MKVSIAMTTYNGEKYIMKQLGSILDQTRQPDEVIICDDGSTDKTAEIINHFINENELYGWHLSVNDVNVGYIENFRCAIGRTTGDIIFLCDQDDVWHRGKIEKMVGIFQENDRVKVLNTGFQKIDQDGNPIPSKQRFSRSNNNLITRKLKPFELRQFTLEYILWRNISPGCTMAFIDEVKSFFSKNATDQSPHDWEINLFGAVLGGLFFYNAALTGYRIHTDNTIGLADLKMGDRFSGRIQDKRILLAEQEYKRAEAYMNAKWVDLLGQNQRRALKSFYRTTWSRFQAIRSKSIRLWLKLIFHIKNYLKLRGPQGVINDFIEVRKKVDR